MSAMSDYVSTVLERGAPEALLEYARALAKAMRDRAPRSSGGGQHRADLIHVEPGAGPYRVFIVLPKVLWFQNEGYHVHNAGTRQVPKTKSGAARSIPPSKRPKTSDGNVPAKRFIEAAENDPTVLQARAAITGNIVRRKAQ